MCNYCLNSTVDGELTPDNDLSYISVGSCSSSYSIFIKSGNGQFTEILFEDRKINSATRLAGYFIPRFCPMCGRELIENKKHFDYALFCKSSVTADENNMKV